MSGSTSARSSAGDGPGDTTLFMATAASYTSDGPTLPIIGGNGEHASPVTGTQSKSEVDQIRPAKRQKTDEKDDHATEKNTPNPEFAALYRPWTLLPPELLKQVERRTINNHFWEEQCIPIVYSKNQNVKSGINKLKALIGVEHDPDVKSLTSVKPAGHDALIAVSSQGPGTTKLVSIIEMTKRIASKAKRDGSVRTWYMYTSLTSIAREKRAGNKSADQDGQHAKDGDEEDKDAKIDEVPVLTVWLSLKSIPELTKAFGEQTFEAPAESGGE